MRAWRNGSRNGLKIRFSKGSAGSSPAARTNPVLARLLENEGQEWSTFIAHGKVVAASLRAILVALWQDSWRFGQEYVSRFK